MPTAECPVLKDVVVIMEDDNNVRAAIIDQISKELNWETITCKNQDEVVDVAKETRAGYFILDNAIGKNKHEGLDALERIKEIDNNSYVAMLSAFPNSIISQQAEKLNCNLFEEKTSIPTNIRHITKDMLKYREEMLTDRELLKEDLQAFNRKAFEELSLNADWITEHMGKFVAFVDGKFEFSCEDRDEFFNLLIDSGKYKESQIFFAKIKKTPRVIDEPTSMWFDR